ncbi:MAG: HAD family phosphatase [Firmicutes bacterium]|nr:HAD family phosphatase [[Eubacterium] siraeum]MCM1489087.1 HAD family phosphatase [Bacillota bacterium]
MKIEAVIFDMDGVILDTETLLAKYWCQAANEFGFPMEYEHALELRSLAGEYAAPLLKKYFGDRIDYTAVRNRRKELMNTDIEKNGLKMKKGVKEILDYLDGTDLKRAIATATDSQRAEQYLKMIGIYERFPVICCGPAAKHGKPAPDIYLMAAEQLGAKPERCIAVEDSPNGIRSAYGAGMMPVMIPDLTPPDEALKKLLFRQCESLAELPPILEELQKQKTY